MTKLSRQSRLVASRVLVVSLLLYATTAKPDDGLADGYALRSQNPFLQVFGLPPLQSATLTQPGETDFAVAFDIANHAEGSDSTTESIAIDGESYFATFSWRRRISSKWELGVLLPFVAHDEGVLDNAIESWHDTFGMSNTKRTGRSNQLEFRYTRDGMTLYELETPSYGIGDIQLSAAFLVKEADSTGGANISLHSSIKLPSGDANKLRGSGAADFSIGIYASDGYSLFGHELDVSGFFGGLLLGDGEILADIQRSTVPYAGVTTAWRATERLGIVAQLYAQGAYYHSNLQELGDESIQLAIGLNFRPRQNGMLFKFAVVEDLVANATNDFGLHFAIEWSGTNDRHGSSLEKSEK